MNPVRQHPNATAAGSTGAAGVLAVWLLGRFGVDVSAEVGAAISTAAATAVLLLGRDGVRGIALLIWRGKTPKQ